MTTATPAIAINDSRKPELAITYGFFNISIIADNDTAERISYLLPSTCAFTAHTNITIARVADTELPVITPNNTTNIPLIIADIGQRKPILRNSLYSPMPISDMWSPDMARICPIPAAEKSSLTVESMSDLSPVTIAAYTPASVAVQHLRYTAFKEVFRLSSR